MQRRPFSLVFVLLVATAMSPLLAMAEDEHAEHAEHAAGVQPHGEEGHHFKNAIALFLGATNEHGHEVWVYGVNFEVMF